MRVSVDAEVCTGCGLCVEVCPEVFALDDDVATVQVDPVPEESVVAAQEAAEGCPVEAIEIVE